MDPLNSLMTSTELNWLVTLIGVNVALFVLFKALKLNPGRELIGCFSMTSVVSVTRCVLISGQAVTDGSLSGLLGSREDRLHGVHEGFMLLAQVTFAYEMWNTLSAIVLPEYRRVEFIGHHLATGLLAKLAQQPYAAPYGLFYFGLASLSTWSLCFVDLMRHGPPGVAAKYSAFYSMMKTSFGIKFFLLRIVAWSAVSVFFWRDVVGVILEGGDGKQKTWVACLFLLANVGLTSLQFLWMGKIAASIKGSKKPKKD